MSGWKHLLLIVSLLCLSSCGWHLRGNAAAVNADAMAVFGPEADFKLRLEQALEDDNVLVHDQAPLILRVSGLQWRGRTVAVDSVGREAERELRVSMHWQLEDSAQQWQSERQKIGTTRRYQVSPDNPAGASDEDQIARNDMQAEMIARIMRSLSLMSLELPDAR